MKQYMKPTITRIANDMCEVVTASSGGCSIKGRDKKTNGCLHNAQGKNGKCPLYDHCDR